MVNSTARMRFGRVSDLDVILTDHRDSRETGGNEALPPLWKEFKVLGNKTRYEDNNLYMGSWCRPLPGIRLGEQAKCYQA